MKPVSHFPTSSRASNHSIPTTMRSIWRPSLLLAPITSPTLCPSHAESPFIFPTPRQYHLLYLSLHPSQKLHRLSRHEMTAALPLEMFPRIFSHRHRNTNQLSRSFAAFQKIWASEGSARSRCPYRLSKESYGWGHGRNIGAKFLWQTPQSYVRQTDHHETGTT